MFFLVGVLGCSLFFLWSSHPVYGVLTLVGVGLASAGYLVGGGLEFPGLIVVVVYVGAVTVLFVFVVMMVNLRSTPAAYPTVEAPLVWAALAATAVVDPTPTALAGPAGLAGLGGALYGTERVTAVLLVGSTLFVGMVAAICLSLTGGETYRSQEFYSQVRRPNSVFVFRPR